MSRLARPSSRMAPWAIRLGVGLAILLVAGAGAVVATPGSGVVTTNISVGRFGELRIATHVDDHKVFARTKGASDLHVVSNVIAPGGHTGWHTHPGPSLITVKSGTITAYSDAPGCPATVYPTGSGFVDPGDGHLHILRNEGSVPAETIAVQLLPAGAPRRIDVPAPGTCAF